jgi:glutathione S-transferase
MPKAVLTISSRNYGAWALRGWLMAKLAKLDFTEHVVPPDDPAMKAEILLLSSSMLVPSLQHQGLKVWDTLAIGEYLHEIKPKAGLLPAEIGARAHCRAICGEMHSGFSSLRSALPMNIKAHFPKYKVWSRAQATSPASSRSGKSAWRLTAGPTCSARTPAWPTRCTRRWSRAS